MYIIAFLGVFISLPQKYEWPEDPFETWPESMNLQEGYFAFLPLIGLPCKV